MLKPSPYLSIFCLTFFFHFNSIAQTPCNSGMAGVYPCDNVDLQSYTNLSAGNLNAGLANDIWGWTAPNGTEYAIVGLDNGTSFVDITDATAPVIIGKLPKHAGTANSTWRDIKVIGNYAYIGSEASGHGIQIFNLNLLTTASNIPTTFSESGWINIGINNRSHNVVANPLTGYIIPVGTAGLNDGGLTFYDVNANPTAPVLAGSYSASNYSHDALCIIYRGPDTEHIGKEICIGFNDNIVAIADVTSKNNPSTISTFSYPGNDYCHQGWITDDHKYLLVDDELDETGPVNATRTYIFDLSNLESPVLKYTYTAAVNAIDHNLYVKGPYAYQSNYTSGLRILDISNLDNSAPTEVGYFDNFPANDNGTFDGTWSVYPYFKSGKLVMTNIDGAYGGLHIITPNLPHYVMEVVDTGIETICAGETATFNFDATAYAGFGGSDNITVTGLPPGAIATLSSNPISTNNSFSMDISTDGTTPIGTYNIILTGTEAPVNRVSVGLTVTSSTPSLPPTQLVSPADGASDQELNLAFSWNPVSGAVFYDLEITTDQTFANIDFSANNLTTTSFTQPGLTAGEVYVWRVMARDNDCEISTGFFPSVFRTIADPLPVELIHFKAIPKKESILLEWQTTLEVGFAGFELQRAVSENSNDFRKITWINTLSEFSNSIKNYDYLDEDVEVGQTYYYRLRQLDLDGTEEFSSIVSARLNGQEGNLQVFPNPAEKIVTLLLDKDLPGEETTLVIYDVAGKQVRSIVVPSIDLKNGYLLDISDLEKGTYLVGLENGEAMKFVKR